MNHVSTIEDCLEILVGLKLDYKFNINSSDMNILSSIGRQVFRSIPLTDRQFSLCYNKLMSYKDQFDKHGIVNFDIAIKDLRMPLREIDRSKYISVVSTADVYGQDKVFESYKAEWEWIKIRFPFSKKDIVKIDEIAFNYRKNYEHQRGSHEHYFKLTENIAFDVVEAFKDKNFVIDKELLELHEEVLVIRDRAEDYIPCIKNSILFNVSPSVLETISNETTDTVQIVDRHRRYGLENFDLPPTGNLMDTIAYRTEKAVQVKPTTHIINELITSIYHLDRLPLIVLLEEAKAEEQIHEFYNAFRNLISNEEQSVLFRQEGKTEFNNFVKTKKLNNWVDRNTKIVYANTNKLPKVLLNAEWSPIAALTYNSGMNRQLATFVSDRCDLVIYYDEHMSPFRRFSNLYEM